MKKTISLFALLFIFQLFTNAQCNVRKYRYIKKYIKEGIYLLDRTYNNKKDKPFKLVFHKGSTYGVYLLNPSKVLPDFELKTQEDKLVNGVIAQIDTIENYALYKFTIKESGQYKIKLNFNTTEKACVLFVLTFISKESCD